MTSYKTAFEGALGRTKKYGLIVSEIPFLEGRLMNPTILYELTLAVRGFFKSLTLEDLKTKQLHIHRELHEIAEETFESPAFFTMGWVQFCSHHYFRFDEEEISKILNPGAKTQEKPKLHAWLTFPTMEILDFSINTILAAELNRPEVEGKTIAAHPSSFGENLQFHPMLVGDDLLNKIPIQV